MPRPAEEPVVLTARERAQRLHALRLINLAKGRVAFRPFTVPDHGPPLVRQLFAAALARRMSLNRWARKAGVALGVLTQYNTRRYGSRGISFATVEALAGALDYEIVLRRRTGG